MDLPELENVRKPWENNEMWKLRRAFLERHWLDKSMTRNRLFCLSQMLVNIEFLGCEYDEALMAKVSELSEGLVEERRERRRDIVEQVVVSEKSATTGVEDKHARKKRKPVDDDEPPAKKQARGTDATIVVTTTSSNCAIKMKILQALKAELVVMQHQRVPDDPLAVLNQATNRAKCRWRIQFNDEKHSCYLQVDEVLIVEQVYWGSQAKSRTEACRRTLEVLQRPFFDVRQVPEKDIRAPDLELELYTRRDVRGEWESSSVGRFDALEQTFMAWRKRLVAVPQDIWKKDSEKFLKDTAKVEDLPVEIKRQHLGGWNEEIIVTVGKVEFHRQQTRIPPKGKEQESASDAYAKAIEFLLRPALGDGIRVTEESGVVVIKAAPKATEKPTAAAIENPAASATSAVRRISREPGTDFDRKELSLKSVRLHLNATSDTMNSIQRIEQSCMKAKVPYDVQFDPNSSFSAVLFVDGVRIGTGSDTSKKGAKNKACNDSIQQLLLPYIRIKQSCDDELVLEASKDPFDG